MALMVDGYSLPTIQESLAGKCSQAAAIALIKEAVATFEEMAQEPEQAIKGFAMCASRELYRRMLEVGDFTGALRAVKQLQELSSK